MSLLENAKEHKVVRGLTFEPGDEDIELALAWVRDEVTMTQAATAWGCTRIGKGMAATTYVRLARSLRAHILILGK